MTKSEDTSALVASSRLDEATVERYLQKHLSDYEGPLTISQFKGGQSNPTYHLETNNNNYVLRKKPAGKLLPTAHAIEREYRVLAALANTDVPVPHVIHFCEDTSIIGTAFYVMEFVPGRVFNNPLLPEMEVEERRAIYDAMNDALVRVHKVDWQSVGLEGYGRPENYFSRQVARWSKQYESTKCGDLAAMNNLMRWLRNNIPDDDITTIAHGDFRLANLLFDTDTLEVVGVLDWELSTLGQPVADLAFNCLPYYLSSDNPVAPGFVGMDIHNMGIPSEDEYVAAYCRRIGRQEIPDWLFYIAFSLFRTAAIQQGVYARSLQGNANSEIAGQFGDFYKTVAETGWALVKSN